MMRRLAELDWGILCAVLALSGIGLLSLQNLGAGGVTVAARQLIWLGVGMVALVACAGIDYRAWGRWAPVLFALNGMLLGVVLVSGRTVHGSRSWLGVGGVGGQPSEFIKLALILVLARILARNREAVVRPTVIAATLAVATIPVGLIALQPDMGTAVTCVGITAAMILVAGLSRTTWIVVVVAALVGGVGMWNVVLKDYQKARIRLMFSDDSAPEGLDYQLVQSRIAIGSGGWHGKGFREGTQSQLDFIPEKKTDFIFSVIAEAGGFAGSALILGLYGFILTRGFRIALQARDAFGAYLSLGIMSLLAIHIFVNLGMVIGLLPTIGIPLPLISYGGSSLVTILAGIGLVLNVGMRRIANV